MTTFVRIHDGEPLWLEVGVKNLHTSIDASDFECAADERHFITIVRAGEEVGWFHQHPDDWTYWESDDGDSCESIFAGDWQVGDRLYMETG